MASVFNYLCILLLEYTPSTPITSVPTSFASLLLMGASQSADKRIHIRASVLHTYTRTKDSPFRFRSLLLLLPTLSGFLSLVPFFSSLYATVALTPLFAVFYYIRCCSLTLFNPSLHMVHRSTFDLILFWFPCICLFPPFTSLYLVISAVVARQMPMLIVLVQSLLA